MPEKFFYATIITALLSVLLGFYPFYSSKNLNLNQARQKYNHVQSYLD
ncbi:hypothetical protein [Hydrocoleum sp. CS-953]|nr:hypothetical protein [Hydrocoleum sp. CS-953]